MARAPFNRSVDVYFGLGTGTPGAFRRTITARVVLCNRQTVTTPSGLQYTHYLTYTGTSLVAGTQNLIAGGIEILLSEADIVTVPSLGGLTGNVIWNELINPGGGRPPYRKSYVLF